MKFINLLKLDIFEIFDFDFDVIISSSLYGFIWLKLSGWLSSI